jgi:hypothetical protein
MQRQAPGGVAQGPGDQADQRQAQVQQPGLAEHLFAQQRQLRQAGRRPGTQAGDLDAERPPNSRR